MTRIHLAVALLLFSLFFSAAHSQAPATVPDQLSQMVIPRVEFAGATPDECIAYFNMKLSQLASPGQPPLSIVGAGHSDIREPGVYLILNNVRMDDALNQFVRQLDYGITLNGSKIVLTAKSYAAHPMPIPTERTDEVSKKLATIIIPEFKFTNLPLHLALEVFANRSAVADPDTHAKTKGVNILGPTAGAPIKINLDLKKVVLGDALHQLAQQAGLTIEIQGGIVVLTSSKTTGTSNHSRFGQ